MKRRRETIPVWRSRGESLERCGTIPASSVWLLDDGAPQDQFSVPGLISRAGQPPPAENEEEDNLERSMEDLERSRSGMHATIAPQPQQHSSSLFQTGTGKSVNVSGAAMERALALLGGENAASSHRKSGGEPALGFSSLGGGERSDGNTLFQTATGKSVSISASALSKAKTLLGGTDNNELKSSAQGLKSRGFSTPSFGFGGGPPKFLASVPPFKQPRRRFVSPLALASVRRFELPRDVTTKTSLPFNELDGNRAAFKRKIPLPRRVKLRDYFQHPPHQVDKDLDLIPGEIKSLTSENAKEYRMSDADKIVGPFELRNMLLETGAKAHLATNAWVENHYRWIVWKLASQQRSYPQEAKGFLSVHNVFRELEYRYAKEVDNGHRSVLKRICEKDTSAARTMVLCISAIRKTICTSFQLEVTDGWYCLNAVLDGPLTRQVKAGKLFVGQKLQITEASLTGAVGGLPPLEAYSVAYLVLHINGTYRAHWADPLGVSKKQPLPLAFKCIKADGGLVPSTCVGITRIYPLLYKERLKDGTSAIRNARAEHVQQMNFEQRRASLEEDVMATLQKEANLDEDEEFHHEGAKLFQLLECASDPEVVMADMTNADHTALSAYQAKRMINRQKAVEKRLQKALEASGLLSRDTTPFFKVSVVGLQHGLLDVRSSSGFITIWNPSDTLSTELVEGEAYVVSGLKPSSQRLQLYLNANKSSKWRKAFSTELTFDFEPRVAMQLQNLVRIPAGSEFDVAVLVMHVGEVYRSGDRFKQWLFVSDGSHQQGQVAMLAIDFSSVANSFVQFESAYAGSVVGFCNLMKQRMDERNGMWVAEASNLTVYSSKLNSSTHHHLCKQAALVTRWSKSSPQVVVRLQQRIEQIISDGA